MATWAIISNGQAIPVSSSERGAKRYATNRGYNRVCRISENAWIICNEQIKHAGKWISCYAWVNMD